MTSPVILRSPLPPSHRHWCLHLHPGPPRTLSKNQSRWHHLPFSVVGLIISLSPTDPAAWEPGMNPGTSGPLGQGLAKPHPAPLPLPRPLLLLLPGPQHTLFLSLTLLLSHGNSYAHPTCTHTPRAYTLTRTGLTHPQRDSPHTHMDLPLPLTEEARDKEGMA